jgi:hypothetical protein
MKNLNIEFNGFYCSKHDAYIEDAINLIFDTEEGGEIPDDINYRHLYDVYSKEWAYKFEEFLNDEILGYCANSERIAGGKHIVIDYMGLNSPKYYNYSTDKIVLNIRPSSVGIVFEYLLDDENFLNYVKESTKSYDGFISFYTFDEVMSDKDEILIVFALNYMSMLFEVEDVEINAFELLMNEI